MNSKMLNPREVVEPVEAAYRQSGAPLVEVEGFVRQIIGWREYVRGVYWGPRYRTTRWLFAPGKLSRHPRLSMVYRNRFAPHGDSSL
ncbi:hypothetical protein [Methylomonas sp. HYX-M1]|uniref:hypothetical protein n=1 Tax=Methylomonas sp. HYX-M1 TaxID=3139307 RepID=UPI00345C4445